MCRKGPEHIATPNRQICIPKGTRNWIQHPSPSSVDIQKQKVRIEIFKSFKSYASGCIYLMGWEILIINGLDPKNLRKRFTDGSDIF